MTNLTGPDQDLELIEDIVDRLNNALTHLEDLVGRCDSLGLPDAAGVIDTAVSMLDQLANGDVEESELTMVIYQLETGAH